MKKHTLFFLSLIGFLAGIKSGYSQIAPIISYNTPQVYTAGTAITTLFPTLNGGTLYPGLYNQPTTFATFDTPFSIATDQLNNVYTTNNNTGDFIKYNAAGNVLFTINTGNPQASEIAVDKLGNIYVSQFTENFVLKYNAAGTLIATINGFNDPYGIAVDASNNAYVADYLSGNILKIAANDTIATTYLSGFTTPYGIAIDANGNIYVGEQSVGDVVKVAAGTNIKTIVASGFNGPRHLSKDAFGNIYVADYGNNAIKRISPAGSVTIILSNGVSSPRQISFDSTGNLFIADYGSNTLQKSAATIFSISGVLPDGLIFNNTTGQISGTPTTPTSATTLTIIASNTGGTDTATVTITVKAPVQAPVLPVITISSPSDITTSTATVSASATSNGGTPTVSFTYGSTPDLSGPVTTISPNTGSGTGSIVFTASSLNPSTTYYYKVTATNASGTTTTSISSFTTHAVVNSTNATLAGLTATQGNFNPSFSSAVKSYTDTVTNAAASIAITAVANDSNATIKINGSIVTSGGASDPITLNIGSNTINVVVTAQDGVTTNTYTLNVTRLKAPQIINFAALAVKTYGDADFDPAATATSNDAVIYTSSNPAVAILLNGKIHIVGAGSANITASQPGNTNYTTAWSVSQTLIVNKTPLTIAANNTTITYGQPFPALTFTYSGFVNGDNPGNLTAQVTMSITATAASPAGVYPITPSGAASNNYTFVYQPGTLTINQSNSNIIFAALSAKNYGDADFALTATSTSGLPITYISSDNSVAVINGSTLHIVGAGTAIITASQASNANFITAASVAQVLTVNKATLIVAANNKNISYGDVIPTLTAAYKGFLNGDDATKLNSPVSISTTAVAGAAAGSYPISLSGGISGNYVITYQPGTLTIGQNSSSITFAAIPAKTYGDADFALTATANSGLPVTYNSSDNTIATINGSTVHIIGTGTVTITASQAGNANYITAVNAIQTLSINKATVTVTANAQNKPYGNADPQLTYKITNGTLYNGDTFSGFLARDAGEQAGTYTIKQGSLALNNNYIINYVSDKLTINKVPLTITANNITIAYGQPVPALMLTYSGFVNNDNPGNFAAQVAITTTATSTSSVGAYVINVSGAVSNNYSFIYQPGILTIGQNNSSITFAVIPAKTYGDADFVLTSTSTSGLPVVYTSSDNSIAVINGNTVHIAGAGTAIITASQPGNINYTTTGSVAQSFTVSKAPLTIAANNVSIAYGDIIPTLAVTYKGFVNGDDATKLNSPVSISTTAAAGSAAGTYPINLNGATSDNYSFTYQPGTLTIGQNSSSITFAAITAKTYGDADFALTAIASSGLPVTYKSSDNNIATINGNTVHIINAGKVIITASQAGSANFSAAISIAQTLVINKAAITLAANTQNKTYGDTDPQLSYTVTNGVLFNGDTFTGTLTRDAGEQAGSYTIKQGSLVINNNYSLTYVPSTLTINKASLIITANNATVAYGQPIPTLTITYSGFVNSDNPGSLAAPVNVSTTAVTGSAAGSYLISVKGATSNNYNFTYQPGILTIGQTTSDISFAAISVKTYGNADFALTSSSTSGLPVTFTSSDNTVAVINGNNVHIIGAGTAIITASQTSNANFTAAASVAQLLTVNKAPLTIAVNNSTIAYGDAIPAFNVTYNGFVNGDDQTKLINPAAVSTTAIAGSSAGNYPITINGAASNNYTIAYQPGTLTIGPNNSSIIFAALPAKTYGDTDFALTATTTSGLPVTYTSSNTAVATIVNGKIHIVGAGSVSISASQATSVNFNASGSVIQILTVNKAPLTITANDLTVGYGIAIPPLTVAYTGFVNGDNANSLTTLPGVSAPAVAGSAVGTYVITPKGAISNNYLLTYKTGTLTIAQTNFITFAALAAKTYGDADFNLGATATNGSTVSYTSSNPAVATILNGKIHIVGAGAANITANQSTSASVTQQLTVNKAPLTITANNINVIYGQLIPSLTVTYNGFVNGDDQSSLNSAAVTNTTASAGSAVGTYPITVSGAASNNYSFTYQPGTLTIAGNNSSIIFADLPVKIYGDLDFAPIATSTSSLPISFTSSDNAVAVIKNGSIHIVGAGSVTITASQPGVDGGVSQTLTVNKAMLTITADNFNIFYGNAIPTLTATYTGFVNGDDASKLTKRPDITVPAISGSPMGSYPISVKGAVSSNYVFNYVAGVLIIDQNNTTISNQTDAPVVVHQAVSPNGDGINDFLIIQGIQNYPNNRVSIMNRNGNVVSQISSYDNSSKVFDGHSNITGTTQQPGTYYYKVDYVVNNQTKSQTGFFVLKY